MAEDNGQGDLLNNDAGGDKGVADAPAAAAAKAAADAASGPGGGDVAALTTEQKAAEQAAADKAKADADKPITYTEFKAPEGMKLDKAALEAVTPMFQKAKLSQEDAQELVSFYAQQLKAGGDANSKAWGDTIKGWQTELKADPDFGGAKLTETTSLAAKAIDAYGGKDAPAIREFMKTYGLGDHPAFARFLARAGRTVREDGLPRGDGGAKPNGDARTHFPNSNMNP